MIQKISKKMPRPLTRSNQRHDERALEEYFSNYFNDESRSLYEKYHAILFQIHNLSFNLKAQEAIDESVSIEKNSIADMIKFCDNILHRSSELRSIINDAMSKPTFSSGVNRNNNIPHDIQIEKEDLLEELKDEDPKKYIEMVKLELDKPSINNFKVALPYYANGNKTLTDIFSTLQRLLYDTEEMMPELRKVFEDHEDKKNATLQDKNKEIFESIGYIYFYYTGELPHVTKSNDYSDGFSRNKKAKFNQLLFDMKNNSIIERLPHYDTLKKIINTKKDWDNKNWGTNPLENVSHVRQ